MTVPWKFFPVQPHGKQPALPGDWRLHATDDEAQLDAWEAEGYNLGLDCGASGVTVIDLDGEEIGRASWAKLCEEHGLPPATYTVRTPRGGLHYYYEGEAATSVQKLGDKIDTRGSGGYVLAAGSETSDGAYTVELDRPLARLPAWIPLALERHKAERAAAVTELDLPGNVARAEAYLAGRAPVEQGNGADAKTFEVACRLRDFGLSQDKIIDIMLKGYKCYPQDDRFDAFITRKVENAHEYAQNDAGAWGLTPGMPDSWAATLDSLPSAPGSEQPDPFRAYTETEQDGFREPEWLAGMQDLIPSDSVVLLYGQPGSYKSFVALDIALTLAAGIPGWGRMEAEPCPVVFVAGEGPRSIARLRRPAWRIARAVSGALPFHLVLNMPQPAMPETIQAFIASIKAQDIRPKLVVIDTWARFMLGLNENDAKDAGQGVAALDMIKRELKCSVLVVHHSGKDGAGPRGSSAIPGGMDTMHEVVAHKATKALAVFNRRQKDADEKETPWHFEGREAGQSLVFHPITADAYRAITVAEDALSGKIVGAALAKLAARGSESAITTQVLASSLYQGPQDEAPEATQAGVAKVVRQLRGAAKGRLEAYCDYDGRELKWSLPAATTP